MPRTVLLLAASLIALAPAASAADVSLVIEGHDEGSTYWFEVEGLEGRNPTIRLMPGDNVTVDFRNVGMQPHNVHFGAPIDQATAILTGGQNATLAFTVPDDASADSDYWCDPHKSLGMIAPLRFGEADDTPPPPREDDGPTDEARGEETPSLGALAALAAVGVAVLVGRRR